MSIYSIRFCKKDELKLLQNFIDKHWRKGHVLATSKELFEFQHLYDQFDDYTFAIALNNETGEIDGAFGLIDYWKYDTTHTIPNAGWTAIWKVRDDVNNSEIGGVAFKLLKFLLANGCVDVFCSLGISQIYKGIATKMHFTVGEMNHYYIVNNKITDFKVICKPEVNTPSNTKGYTINTLPSLDNVELAINNLNPFKNIVFYRNRYENHPFFKYVFWGVYQKEELKAVFVIRHINVNGRRIIRIMDIIGDLCPQYSIYDSIQKIIGECNAEYVDCLNAGIDETLFIKLGFTKINREYGTIIPEHLNPLELKYIPLEYAYISEKEPVVIFKGDGDQDRPNSLSEICLRN